MTAASAGASFGGMLVGGGANVATSFGLNALKGDPFAGSASRLATGAIGQRVAGVKGGGNGGNAVGQNRGEPAAVRMGGPGGQRPSLFDPEAGALAMLGQVIIIPVPGPRSKVVPSLPPPPVVRDAQVLNEETRRIGREILDAARNAWEWVIVHAKEVGSYTNTHASGKTYSGKGSRQRSQDSGRRIEQQTGDQHTATDWTPAENDEEAFKDEARRLEEQGGPQDQSNYNQIESPGKKLLEAPK